VKALKHPRALTIRGTRGSPKERKKKTSNVMKLDKNTHLKKMSGPPCVPQIKKGSGKSLTWGGLIKNPIQTFNAAAPRGSRKRAKLRKSKGKSQTGFSTVFRSVFTVGVAWQSLSSLEGTRKEEGGDKRGQKRRRVPRYS